MALLDDIDLVAEARLLDGVFAVMLDGIVYDCFLNTSFVELRFEAGLYWLRLCLLLFVLDYGWWVEVGAPVRYLLELLSCTFDPG